MLEGNEKWMATHKKNIIVEKEIIMRNIDRKQYCKKWKFQKRCNPNSK